LRRCAPDLPRPLRLAGLSVVAPFAFVCASLVLYWARWPLTGQILFLIVAALPVYIWYQAKAGWPEFARELKGALWMVLYLPAMALLSYIGSVDFGGIGLLPYGVDMAVVAAASLGFYFWGVNSGWYTRYLRDEHDPKLVEAMQQEAKASGKLAEQRG
ncbi:amino acid:proton symporter, partial [Chromobacterium violaceum]|nr:amino acid:proton symporter [Chromobacterium violaceum]